MLFGCSASDRHRIRQLYGVGLVCNLYVIGIELHNSRPTQIVAAMGVEQRKTACLVRLWPMHCQDYVG